MSRLSIPLSIATSFLAANTTLAAPMAPFQEARAEYNPATGNIQVSVNSVANWWVEHVGFSSMTGDEPNGLVTDHDIRIGQTPGVFSVTCDINLGNVAATSIPDNGTLKIFRNAFLGAPTLETTVAFGDGPIVPEPSTAILAAIGLACLVSRRRR